METSAPFCLCKKQRKEGDRNLRAEADKPAAAQNLP